jgi:hypothetical protein
LNQNGAHAKSVAQLDVIFTQTDRLAIRQFHASSCSAFNPEVEITRESVDANFLMLNVARSVLLQILLQF